jgi:hypothetical protein
MMPAPGWCRKCTPQTRRPSAGATASGEFLEPASRAGWPPGRRHGATPSQTVAVTNAMDLVAGRMNET